MKTHRLRGLTSIIRHYSWGLTLTALFLVLIWQGLVLYHLGFKTSEMNPIPKPIDLPIGGFEQELADELYKVGNVYLNQGNFPKAQALFKRALIYKPNFFEILYNLGGAYMTHDQPELAIENYQKALAIKPHDKNSHNNIGIAYYRVGKINDAYEHFKAALRLAPNDPSLKENIAVLKEQMKSF